MPGPLDKLEDKDRKKLSGGAPRFRKPMLATLTRRRFSDADWIFERKLGSEREIATSALCRPAPRQGSRSGESRRSIKERCDDPEKVWPLCF